MESIRKAGSVLLFIALLAGFGIGCGDSDGGGNGTGGTPQGQNYDLVIQNGRIIDPLTATDRMGGAVAIRNGKIAAIEYQAESIQALVEGAARVIDAEGRVVSPGFINTHTHEGIIQESMPCFVKDGITTWIGGNCGFSEYPIGDFFARIEAEGIYNNYASLIGLNTLRTEVGLGEFDEAAPDQIPPMVDMLAQDMAQGSMGISFGAFYHPGCTYEEMLATAT